MPDAIPRYYANGVTGQLLRGGGGHEVALEELWLSCTSAVLIMPAALYVDAGTTKLFNAVSDAA